MIAIAKRFVTYVSLKNWAFPQAKFIVHQGSWLFLGEQSCRQKGFFFPLRTWLLFMATQTLLLWEHGCSIRNNLNLFFTSIWGIFFHPFRS